LYTRCETLDLKTVEILAPARGVQPETAGIIVIAPIAVMNEAIRKLIERINPPGRVKNDADTAFKAHFPCLADGKMLARHGKALLAPRLPHGSGDEYRNRVASASFFLTRAGERAYVISQLEAHFGARYLLSEAFLELYIKIRDLSDADRPRVLEFLDSTLDPNILLTVAERFHFIDMMLTDEALGMAANRTDTDVWLPKGGFCYDGRLLCDQGIETLCGGSWVCDGPRLCNRFMPARGTGFDTIRVSVYPNGDTGAAARLTVPAMRGCTRRQLYRMTGGIAKKRREGEAV
jgi:hypothetical protein